MVLLLPLLRGAALLATALALRQETTTSGTVVARSSNDANVPDTLALIPQQLSHQTLNNPLSTMEPCNVHDIPSDNNPKATAMAHPGQTSTELGQIERRHSQQPSEKCKRAGGGNADQPPLTIYKAKRSMANKEFNVVKETCDHVHYPQACAHYYSAINEGQMSAKFTCTAGSGGRKGTATRDWTRQHTNTEWQSFTARSARDRHGQLKAPNCQADEYPPAYFAKDDSTAQLIRWIPHFDNNGAAQTLWTGFCAKYDGDVGNGQRVGLRKDPEEERMFNKDLVDLKGERGVKKDRGEDGRVTVNSIWDEAIFTRAVFSLVFSYQGDETPKRSNQWHLESNPCWPKAIVPDDPGYVLLTSDEWYNSHKDYKDAKYNRGRYRSDPTEQELQKAKKEHKKNGRRARASPEMLSPEDKRSSAPLRPQELERLELHEGRLIARDIETNTTRPLTDDEIRDQIEVVSCKDKQCSAELQGRDIDANALLIPAIPPPSLPSTNENAVPTFSPTPSMRTEIKPMKRTNVSPDAPTMTS